MIFRPTGNTMDDFAIQLSSQTTKSKDSSNDTPASIGCTQDTIAGGDAENGSLGMLRRPPRIPLPPPEQARRRRSDKEQTQRHDNDVVSQDIHPFSTHPKPNVTREEREQKQEEPPATKRAPLPESFKPTPYTVIIGRHSEAKTNLGNKRLQILASNYLSDYSAAHNRRIKTAIVNEIRETILKANGMFIVKNRVDKTDKRWYHASDAVVREKIGYVLRDLLSHMYRSTSRAKVERKRLQKMAEGAGVAGVAKARTMDSSFLHDMSFGRATSAGADNTAPHNLNEDNDKNMIPNNKNEILGRVFCAPACSTGDDVLSRPNATPSLFALSGRETTSAPGGADGNTPVNFPSESSLLDDQPKGRMMNMKNDGLHPWHQTLERVEQNSSGSTRTPVGDHVLTPPLTRQDKRRRKDSFDVDELLHTGLLPTNSTVTATTAVSSSTGNNNMSHATELLLQASNLMLLSDEEEEEDTDDEHDEEDPEVEEEE